MHKVLEKAQELAEAIVDCEIYQRMHKAELLASKDEAAGKAMADFIEKRQAVEGLLADSNMDRDALAKAGQEMEEAEKLLNEVPLVKEMQDARKEFTQMMENVNQLLRLIITGEVENNGGCTGDCSSCGGCH